MPKGRNPGYIPGDNWAICDVCGFAYRQKDLKKTWDGLVVCKEDFEPRHPQDLVRGKQENTVPGGFVRPEPTEQTADVTYADTSGQDHQIPDGSFNNEL